MIRKFISVCSLLGVLLISAQAHADVFVPDGVLPGEQYQLAFVTAGATTALSDDINDYNDFVQAQAEMNAPLTGTDMGIMYTAIASTPTVAANANAMVVGPVYLIGGSGALIATDASDMWDSNLSAAISNNQYGDNTSVTVWTGSIPPGTQAPNMELGSPFAVRGASFANDSTWIAFGPGDTMSQSSLYALSSPITAPGAVPEPTSFVVWIGLGLLGTCRRRSRVA